MGIFIPKRPFLERRFAYSGNPALSSLRETAVLTVQNGIPWWYFQKEAGALGGTHLRSLDPKGTLSTAIAADRIIGCVVYPAAALVEPGTVQHMAGHRFSLGELDGRRTERANTISQAFSGAGFRSRVIPHIRSEI